MFMLLCLTLPKCWCKGWKKSILSMFITLSEHRTQSLPGYYKNLSEVKIIIWPMWRLSITKMSQIGLACSQQICLHWHVVFGNPFPSSKGLQYKLKLTSKCLKKCTSIIHSHKQNLCYIIWVLNRLLHSHLHNIYYLTTASTKFKRVF